MLLEDCVVSPDALVPTLERLRQFAERYQPRFLRHEQRELCVTYLEGLLRPLRRKSVEPIANAAGLPRRDLQRFVGAGKWDHDAVAAELRAHATSSADTRPRATSTSRQAADSNADPRAMSR